MAQEGPSTADTRRGIHQCNSQGCICCKHILKGSDLFQSAATGNIYEIPQSLTCKTPSVIYVIQCKECKVQYVGKTSTTLQKRFKDHRSSIRKCQHRPIPDHFTKNGHRLDDLIIYPIEQVTGSKELSERELHWIRVLDTVENGLNLGPYKCVRPQTQDDGDKRPVEPTEGQVEDESPQKGKRKLHGNEDVKSKKRKMKNNRQSVFSYETEELLSTCEDAFQVGKDAISEVDNKLEGVSCRENSFLEDLKEKISSLKDYNHEEKIYIGFFGKTGAGKSSLINAIVEESQLLPSGSMHACTSVFVHVQANTESSKYKADIEFISAEDWKSELRFLRDSLKNENDQDSLKNENDQQDTIAENDDGIAEMAKEKITAVYGEEGLKKVYGELVGAREFPVVLGTGMKTLTFDTVAELSEGIECYIRSDTESDTNEGKQFWPLVKRVTISLPKSPALLEGIVLVDLPGAGDVSKYRSDMWKECLSQCSSVWIVNDMKRALSEKVANEIFDTSLRTIAGGGECYNITFICTHTDIINPENFRKNYRITDEDLNINKDTPEYEKKEKQACILCRNQKFKDKISKVFKAKTKKFLLGDEDRSNEFFDVFTVSSEEFKSTAQGKSTVLDRNETELPALMEHMKKLYVSHFEKKVKDYVSEVSGIISYLHFSKDALSSKKQSSNDDEFNRLEKVLGKTCEKLNENLSQVHQKLQKELEMGVKTAETTCLKNATDRVLESCNICRAELAWHGSTSMMLERLKRRHFGSLDDEDLSWYRRPLKKSKAPSH
ncbi:nuclear GTPase SLIP-GC-like isoform X2 [Conger conger]|uniref:nuclear GTPase SLIP-GC-like isoform X2 n=1 Tax=Conger conger TaxID=82655 RepID=UPI002A5A3F3C|nr:nuclear GTPase SLIP-GC-like isoform X2 [Conger conger]